MSQPRFLLYSSQGCHLCEQAELLLGSIPQLVEAGCEMVEITFDDGLVAAYGHRIPVLFDREKQTFHDWPFAQSEIMNLFY